MIFTVKRLKIGPFQLVIHVVQNRHAGEQVLGQDKLTKSLYHLKR